MPIKHLNTKARRARRVHSKITGSAKRPRLSVSRSNKHLFAQLIDDAKGRTLTGLSTKKLTGDKTARAKLLGEHLAKQAKTLKISQAVFDRGNKRYHGRLQALADAARQHGLRI